MHSKARGLLLSHLIIIVVLGLTILLLDTLLAPALPSLWLRIPLLLLAAALLYLFIAPSVITPFLETDEKLKEMLEHTLHELNTPIATIETNVKLLSRKITDPKDRKRLERISGAAANLSELYESIEYKIKENIDYLPATDFMLHDLIDERIRRFDESRGDITVTNETENYPITTDRQGFAQVIDNLLSNAIKYNKPGGYVRFYTRENKLCIEDSGIGIDPGNLFIVYEKSFQENPTTVGFGLGLSIVKNFCDKAKIAIKIDTKKGEGTTFCLDLTPVMRKSL